MFILELIFYALEGFMGSSFLTTINVSLGLYSALMFLKLIVQFGLPNHPTRFVMYLVSLSAASYFTMKGLASLEIMPPMNYMKLRVLPLVIGGLALLIQVISSLGHMSLIQQKIFSRLPLMAGLFVFAFFPSYADYFFAVCLILTALFLSVLVGKARYQKRLFFKMMFFIFLFWGGVLTNYFWSYTLGELFLFPALFYFFIFQQTLGVSAMVETFQMECSGEAS